MACLKLNPHDFIVKYANTIIIKCTKIIINYLQIEDNGGKFGKNLKYIKSLFFGKNFIYFES